MNGGGGGDGLGGREGDWLAVCWGYEEEEEERRGGWVGFLGTVYLPFLPACVVGPVLYVM
jgi:hypothetical protein